MPDPLPFLSPVLEVLSGSLNILPATGGAVEELQRPDQDELEDLLINRDSQEITAFAETQNLQLPLSIDRRLHFFVQRHICTNTS